MDAYLAISVLVLGTTSIGLHLFTASERRKGPH